MMLDGLETYIKFLSFNSILRNENKWASNPWGIVALDKERKFIKIDNLDFVIGNRSIEELLEIYSNSDDFIIQYILKNGRSIVEDCNLFLKHKEIIDNKIDDILEYFEPLKELYNSIYLDTSKKIVLYQSCILDYIPENDKDIVFINIDDTLNKLPEYLKIFDSTRIDYLVYSSIKTNRSIGNGFLSTHSKLFTANSLLSYFDNLVSDDGVLLPFKQIKNRYDSSSFFIKPDSGSKIFPGQVVKLGGLDIFDKTYRIPDDTLCFVSSVKNIVSEKRAFLNVESREIMDSSLYFHDGIETPGFTIEEAVSDLVNNPNIELYDFVVADFALMDDGSVKLIELNAPFTSGFYDCDIKKISRNIFDTLEKEKNK